MSQYSSRIHIQVSTPEIWSRFIDNYDGGFELGKLADTNETSFIINGEWSENECGLDTIVAGVAKFLHGDGIIIADTTNINVDPYYHYVYYLGERVKTYYWDCLENRRANRDGNIYHYADICDFAEWLNVADIPTTKSEKIILENFGVGSKKKGSKTVYLNFSANINLPEEIILRETGFEERVNYLEIVSVDDEVILSRQENDIYNDKKIDVLHNGNVIGSLPSDVGDKLAVLIDINKLEYSAKIIEVVPLSKRNIHAKSPIVVIKIDV